MEILKRFKDPHLARRIIEGLNAALGGRSLRVMEVCGTHTMAISRTGIRSLLRGRIELVSGPGCPVCVTDVADIDRMLAYARLKDVTVVTFGDMIRVPGTETSLLGERTRGADIRVVYSPLEAVQMAKNLPDRKVVFLGVGFETTAPVVALALETARQEGIGNFLVYSAFKVVPPAIRVLLEDQEIALDGFLLPGHVSTVTGSLAFAFIGKEYGLPAVVAGFEAVDILTALHRLTEAHDQGRSEVINAYTRAVREDGNPAAREILEKCFETVDARWRGIGKIPQSGLKLREAYAAHDAEEVLPVSLTTPPREPAGCRCGEVLKGKLVPPGCPLFGRACVPESPVGPCMVSSEGSCAAYYRYDRGEGRRA